MTDESRSNTAGGSQGYGVKEHGRDLLHNYASFMKPSTFLHLKNSIRNFPGGPVVKNPPSNAGDTGSIPGQGTEIPHAMGQLSPHATTTELVRLN